MDNTLATSRLHSSSFLGFPSASDGKNLSAMQETQVWFLGQEDPLEKRMATHSSILAWREEPDSLQSIGSQRVGLRDIMFSTQMSWDN